MGATDVVQGYFDAWNRHDPEAIAATFVQGGTYTDPNAPEGLSGRAIAEYSSDLFAAFPDLLFDLVSHSSTDDEVVAARWVMCGTNTGPLRGKPSERRHRRPAWRGNRCLNHRRTGEKGLRLALFTEGTLI